MPCEPTPAFALPQRRSFAGWVGLGVLVGLCLFYAATLRLVTSRSFDEAYRRTLVTGELVIVPRPEGGAADSEIRIEPGRRIDLKQARRHLQRFGWTRLREDGVYLWQATGRIYFTLADRPAALLARHRLRLDLICGLSDGQRLAIAVNGAPVGEIACAQEPVSAGFDLPAGLIGVGRYNDIAVTRIIDEPFERLLTALGARLRAVEADGFVIDRIGAP